MNFLVYKSSKLDLSHSFESLSSLQFPNQMTVRISSNLSLSFVDQAQSRHIVGGSNRAQMGLHDSSMNGRTNEPT